MSPLKTFTVTLTPSSFCIHPIVDQAALGEPEMVYMLYFE